MCIRDRDCSMKILFLNPPDMNKVDEYAPDEKSEEYIGADNFGAFPPLGIMYVMAYLEKSLIPSCLSISSST